MSTIKCPHCGRKISPEALQCPHCGCPGSIIAKTAKFRAKWKAIGLVALLIIFTIGYFSNNKNSNHKDSTSSPAVEQQVHTKVSTKELTEIKSNGNKDKSYEESTSEVKQKEEVSVPLNRSDEDPSKPNETPGVVIQNEEVSIPFDKLDEFLSKPNETPNEVNQKEEISVPLDKLDEFLSRPKSSFEN